MFRQWKVLPSGRTGGNRLIGQLCLAGDNDLMRNTQTTVSG